MKRAVVVIAAILLAPLLSAAGTGGTSGGQTITREDAAIIKNFPISAPHPNGCYLKVYFARKAVVGMQAAYCEAMGICGGTFPASCK